MTPPAADPAGGLAPAPEPPDGATSDADLAGAAPEPAEPTDDAGQPPPEVVTTTDPDDEPAGGVPEQGTAQDDEPAGGAAEPTPIEDDELTAAVELARAAAEEEAPGQVGEHVDCTALSSVGAPVAVHRFASLLPSYAGWCWSVSLTRVPGEPHITVDEVVLEPGAGALLPPVWVPWSERLQPGDLGVGDLLPTGADDERLVPAYLASGDPAVDAVAMELGLGRVRVMSRLGRVSIAERWYDGPTGPESSMARQAPGPCGTCGFYLPLEGSLRAMIGVCGNEYAPNDGRVVVASFGCGAHSEAAVEPEPEPLTQVTYDTQDYDLLSVGGVEPADGAVGG